MVYEKLLGLMSAIVRGPTFLRRAFHSEGPAWSPQTDDPPFRIQQMIRFRVRTIARPRQVLRRPVELAGATRAPAGSGAGSAVRR